MFISNNCPSFHLWLTKIWQTIEKSQSIMKLIVSCVFFPLRNLLLSFSICQCLLRSLIVNKPGVMRAEILLLTEVNLIEAFEKDI